MKLPSETIFMNPDMTAFLIPVLSVAQSPEIKQVPGIQPVHLTPLNRQLRYHFFFFIVNTGFYLSIYADFPRLFSILQIHRFTVRDGSSSFVIELQLCEERKVLT